MDHRVQTVISLMEENLAQEPSPEELARFVNLSPSHLRCLFKVETGQSLARYLKGLRMKKARELLDTTFLNVKQILNQIGVRDKSHFAHDFKEIYGMTPKKYRTRSANVQAAKN